MTASTTRTALVTGSARGIGLAIARALTAEGFDVIGVDVLEHDGQPFARTLRADLSDVEDCERVAAVAANVALLVNNAALPGGADISDVDTHDIDRLLAVNLRAPILLARAAAVGMAARGHGRIVNIASIGARTGGLQPSSGVYSATKAGLVAFTKFLARMYASAGVTANAVAPGGIASPMAQDLKAGVLDSYRRAIPAGRLGTPDEVAAVVAFLAGDGASFINGATIDVNGGWVMA